jgi:GntR family transcriptional regulator
VILSVDIDSALPPFEQIRTQITAMAASGVLPPGTRLPAIRQLAADLGLAPGTVSRAYRELEATGIITARGRHGSHIARPPTMSPYERAIRLRREAADYAQLAGQLGASPREAILALQEVTAASRPAS